MKKNIAGLVLFLLLAAAAEEQQTGTVVVTGDRVSLRAGPSITEVLLGRAMSGDTLTLKDNSNPEWVGVIPPETIDLWVHRDYVQDDAVLPEKLNIRSGPSFNHSVVGTLTKGQTVIFRGGISDWLRIAPTADATIWISRTYADVKLPECEGCEKSKLPPLLLAEVPETNTTDLVSADESTKQALVKSIKKEVSAESDTPTEKHEPTLAEVVTVNALSLSDAFKPDLSKKQGVVDRFSGILKPENEWIYRLVDADVPEITICYVRGNAKQMKACCGRELRLAGKTYWAIDLDLPIIVPARIELIKR
jgi:uncharacterized protein YraI